MASIGAPVLLSGEGPGQEAADSFGRPRTGLHARLTATARFLYPPPLRAGLSRLLLAESPNLKLQLGIDMTESPQPANIDDRIVELVQQCWQEHQMPLLLSRLGTQEGGRIAERAKHQAGGLADYLHKKLSDRVRVIRHSMKPMIVGAVPTHVDIDTTGDIDALLEKTYGRIATLPSPPRFHPAIWAAFRKLLAEENRRYISLQPPFRFVDTPQMDELAGLAEVERRYVAGPDAEKATVLQNLQRWLTANELDASLFVPPAKTASTHLPSDDLLGRLLRALDPDDLKRITMPLDVIAKLRREPL